MDRSDRSPTNPTGQVNWIKQQKFQNKGRGQSVKKGKKGGQSHKTQKPGADQSQRCFKCNRFGHFARDPCCPARDKECEKCGTRGHFAACCWKREATKPPPRDNQGSYQARNRTYHVEDGATGPEDGYAFVVRGQQETGEITLKKTLADDKQQADIEVATHEAGLEELVNESVRELAPKHPIVYDAYNLCEKKLSEFSITVLKNICTYFGIDHSNVIVRRRQPYVDKLQSLCQECACQR
ncbi:phosphatidylinositol-3,4,5-trisphosphate binding [Desmophyllum pertusum]|uniref:Phosphatidylinositol-3,4,5-trisphosphate binding n=1 Tax=Desmophyllum pertusum TaxID=174260 RepID=A0A9W9YHY6_9CNID|nr:phosphatidylinositol-3,4,5-trisphosphate binding [Desmophyllum pertusum]